MFVSYNSEQRDLMYYQSNTWSVNLAQRDTNTNRHSSQWVVQRHSGVGRSVKDTLLTCGSSFSNDLILCISHSRVASYINVCHKETLKPDLFDLIYTQFWFKSSPISRVLSLRVLLSLRFDSFLVNRSFSSTDWQNATNVQLCIACLRFH